ncbi:M23 family metallopeptidase [Anaerotruncus colihominis]|uniref:M23 family metallopeptidase n=1 Tax=Anaerotruncus colihominis TaxID=169435 RepID=A0A845SZG3_9FIRM|nr:M23 family metallopeptidase [Anaerotruncus colihominis]MCR2024530.1 M23 family metallopeptidase [Anaerotruncus colihominis]NDO39890.1 M23 family metallopeptidase [Anaerotruncus colihominis]
MTVHTAHPPRRRPGAPARSGKKKDPYLFLMTVQIALCILLGGVSFALVQLNPMLADEVGAQYNAYLEPGGGLTWKLPSDLPVRIGQAADRAADWLSQKASSLFMPRGQTPPETVDSTSDAQRPSIGQADSAQQPSTESMPLDAWNAFVKAEEDDHAEDAISSAPETQAQTTSAPPGGAGGWMDAKRESGKAAPDSCALAPIFVSALVEPPSSGTVTSLYGWREHPISGADDFHRGLDIAAPEGVGVYAALPGRVAEVDTSPIYGNYITLDHGGGLQTTYCHCLEIVAPVGANLRRGELLAYVGSTGISTGPHVHFEINLNGKYYNPAWVLDGMDGYGI